MADAPETPSEDAKLELPKLRFGFGRRKKHEPAEDGPEAGTAPEPETGSEPDPGSLTSEPDAAPEAEPEAEQAAPAEEAPAEEPPAEESAAEDAPDQPTQVLPAAGQEPAGPAEEPTSQSEGPAEPADTAEATEPAARPVPAESSAAASGSEPRPDTEPDSALVADQTEEQETEAEAEAAEHPVRHGFRLPAIDERVAAVLTGLVVGLGIVVLTFLSARGCAMVKGTASCGGVGLFLLVAIMALAVLLGAALLRAFGVPDALSSSFLAVGLIAVLAMLFFLPEIDSVWMVLVIPLLTAATYLFSWWITYTFIDSDSKAA